MEELLLSDLEIGKAVYNESLRQISKLELIASENFTSPAVREAQGSILTHKYAEGYPGKRYYGGCEYVDVVENLAIDRAKKLFEAEYINVQPHSGSQANMAVYFSALKPGDVVLGMDLSHGGHLTHGSPVNFSGKFFTFTSYGVDKTTGLINYEAVEEQAKKYKPSMIVAGASAYSRIIDFSRMRSIADSVGALLMVDMAHIAGLVAAGLHPSPIPHAHFTTSTTHKTLRGPRGGLIFSTNDREKSLNSQIFPGIQGGPLMHVIAAKAIAFGEALKPAFKLYQQRVITNAKALAHCLQEQGFSIVSGGTDNHLFLVDLTPQDITGSDAESALDKAGITVNKNTVPFETRSPFVTSGIRIGTAAITTRGMGTEEMKRVGQWISNALEHYSDDKKLVAISKDIEEFSRTFPLFSW